MQLPQHIAEAILNAENKALATEGAHGINVVPVSTLRIVDGKIWLMNYFLGKTLENILMRPHVALACWKGLEGYQIKGAVLYVDEGELFTEAAAWVKNNVRNRTLKGVLIITPQEIHVVSPPAGA